MVKWVTKVCKEFKIDKSCEYPYECRIAKECFRARVVKIELIHPQKDRKSLKNLISSSECRHAQMKEAVGKAKKRRAV